MTKEQSTNERIYSAEEIDAFFHFIKLPTPLIQSSTTSVSTPVTVEWWPCFVFQNMMELQMVTDSTQFQNLWNTLPNKKDIMMQYMQHLPDSASCRVALLLSLNTSGMMMASQEASSSVASDDAIVLFDIDFNSSTNSTSSSSTSFVIEPFYDRALYYGAMYAKNESFLHAMKQYLPFLLQKGPSTTSSSPATTEAVANTTNDHNKSNTLSLKKVNHNSTPATARKNVPTNKKNDDNDLNNTSETRVTRSSSSISKGVKKSSKIDMKGKSGGDEIDSKSQNSIKNNRNHNKDKKVSTPITTTAVTSKKPAKIPIPNIKYEFVEIPKYSDVKPILIKGGYNLSKPKKFGRPPIISDNKDDNKTVNDVANTFPTITDLRHDLCIYGVNCQCGSTHEDMACHCWTADEKWVLKLWVRYDVLRSPIIVNENRTSGISTPISHPVKLISKHQATQYLIRLQYRPSILGSILTTEEQINDIFRYLSQYGLPSADEPRKIMSDNTNNNNFFNDDDVYEYCDYTQITPEERLTLEYFISTNHFRVKTFTYTFPDAIGNQDIQMKDVDSPTLTIGSAIRPKRTAVRKFQQLQRLDDTSNSSKKPKISTSYDEGSGEATIVSIESQSSSTQSEKEATNRKNAHKVLKKSSTCVTTPTQGQLQRKSNDNMTSSHNGKNSFYSPINRNKTASVITNHSTKEVGKFHQRVSLSPMPPPTLIYEKESIPVFKGPDQQRLESCLETLQTAYKADLPTICFEDDDETNSKKSKFATNIRTVWNFANAVLLSKGRHGRGGIYNNDKETSAAALYVCGAPGLGKTSGVRWCCDNVAKSSSFMKSNTEQNCELKVLHLNASYLTSQSTPMTVVLGNIGELLGLNTDLPHESTVKKHLTKNNVVLMVVIDEVDAFVTGQGRTNASTDCLRRILRWANNPNLPFGLIGISNCMNDDKFKEISILGKFLESVMFSPYNEHELQQILLARVGVSVIAPNVIDYIAKKVASSSGDARKALEMASNAVEHRLAQCGDLQMKSTETHLVKMPNVIQANKEEAMNLKERISGLPLVGKVILCVLTSYAQAGGAVDTTVGELKQCVSECMRSTGMEDEMVQMDDFLVLLETLVDSGLLRASSKTSDLNNGDGVNLSRRTLSDVHRMPIRLGIQLDDIEKVLESDLKQNFYQKLRDHAKTNRQEG